MRRLVCSCLALCAAAASGAVVAKPILLQTVDLAGMSTEGGEANLYRASEPALAPCRIEVWHYGESGKATYVFIFGSKLYSAVRTDFEYNMPFYMPKGGRVVSAHSITLRTAEGRKRLPTDFKEYEALFDPHKLARCRGR
jgi:hypothetical protein